MVRALVCHFSVIFTILTFRPAWGHSNFQEGSAARPSRPSFGRAFPFTDYQNKLVDASFWEKAPVLVVVGHSLEDKARFEKFYGEFYKQMSISDVVAAASENGLAGLIEQATATDESHNPLKDTKLVLLMDSRTLWCDSYQEGMNQAVGGIRGPIIRGLVGMLASPSVSQEVCRRVPQEYQAAVALLEKALQERMPKDSYRIGALFSEETSHSYFPTLLPNKAPGFHVLIVKPGGEVVSAWEGDGINGAAVAARYRKALDAAKKGASK